MQRQGSDDCEPLRISVKARIDALKKSIISTRPLGSQIDTCKAAIVRAKKRRDEWQEKKATRHDKEREESQTKAAAFTVELDALQATFADEQGMKRK